MSNNCQTKDPCQLNEEESNVDPANSSVVKSSSVKHDALDGERNNKVQASAGASSSDIHGGMDCDSTDKIQASICAGSAPSQSCFGKSPSRESDMYSSDSSVSTLGIAALCESELR